MALDSWRDSKEQVRQAIDIVDLVGSYAQLRRQGRDYVALCPWHDDTKPSLHVNPERQTFKCFVCDIGGDVFSFLMRMEGIAFPDALKMLAERAGIALAAPDHPRAAEASDEKQLLLQAMAWAETQYHRFLLDAPEAEPGREYFAKRRISEASIARFHLGYAPNSWDWLLSRAARTPYSPKVLERIGLVAARNAGTGYYDRFRGRVLFPIRDAQIREARPIAMGGRILPQFAENEPAKYINSPETPLFSKNRQVYGLDLARDSVSKSRNVIVVEGYTDCVIAHQFGVENVVAVLGTALGEKHIGLLRRFADTITLVLDGDEAGQKRTNQILELFVAAQVDLRILTLPENLDPADFLIARGKEAFDELLTTATVDALEHKIRIGTAGLDPTRNTHQAHTVLEDVLQTMSRAPRLATGTVTAVRLREEQVLARLSQTFHVPEEQLRGRMTELRRKGHKPVEITPPASPTAAAKLPAVESLDLWDRGLLELVMLQPQTIEKVAETVAIDDLRTPVCRAIYGKCLELFEQGLEPSFEQLMLESEDPGMKNLLVRLEEYGRAKTNSDSEQWLADVLASFAHRKEDAEHDARFQRGARVEGASADDLSDLLNTLRSRPGKLR